VKLKNLIVFVTNACNSKCVMCFNMDLNKGVRELTLQEYSQIAKNIDSLDELLFSGGEPSLREDLPQIAEVFYKMCNIKKIRIPMNGINTEKILVAVSNVLKLCPNAKIFVTLPLDGLGNDHDKQRGITNAFDRLIGTYNKLKDLRSEYKRLNVGFVTTVTRINYDNIEKIIEYAGKMNPKPSHHNLMVCRAQSKRVTDDLLITPQMYEKIIKIENKYQNRWIENRYNWFLATWVKSMYKMINNVYLYAYKNQQIIKCKAEEFIRIIEANGDVRICEMTETIGNLKEHQYNLGAIKTPNSFRSIVKKCFCTHPCFVIPSLRYPSNLVRYTMFIIKKWFRA